MSTVLYEVQNRIAYITLNRAEKRNSFNQDLVQSLQAAFQKAEEDATAKVVVLRANGEVFCAGADLEYLQQMQQYESEENLQDSYRLMELFQKIYSLKKVVIAQVQGHAIAGGCGLVSVCDFAFAASTANFGYSEVKIGFVPAIVMGFLIKKVGEARAKEMLLTGTFIKAKEAEKWHLITQSIEEENTLPDVVSQFAQKLCTGNSATSMELIKKMMSETQALSLVDNLKYAAEINAYARSTEDCKKGIHAFLNKQKMEW